MKKIFEMISGIFFCLGLLMILIILVTLSISVFTEKESLLFLFLPIKMLVIAVWFFIISAFFSLISTK